MARSAWNWKNGLSKGAIANTNGFPATCGNWAYDSKYLLYLKWIVFDSRMMAWKLNSRKLGGAWSGFVSVTAGVPFACSATAASTTNGSGERMQKSGRDHRKSHSIASSFNVA